MPRLLSHIPTYPESPIQIQPVTPSHPPTGSNRPSSLAGHVPGSGPAPPFPMRPPSFRPVRRSGQHDVVVVERLQELRMPDELGDTARP